MKTKSLSLIGGIFTAMIVGLPHASAADRYSDELESLQEEVARSLSKIDENMKVAFLKACEEEMVTAAEVSKAQKAASAKNAKNKEDLAESLKKSQEAASRAQANAQEETKALLAEVEPFLASDTLGASLVKCAVLSNATPKGLAGFARQGREQEALVRQLLGDVALMKQMLIAGGAKDGHYGEAMRIYTNIRKASPKASEGEFQRLALATALEHAVPVAQSNPAEQPDAPAIVDPVKRYLHYEKAYLAGELDPAFKDLSVWEYRMVVNSDAPDEILAWGREMLRNYRPDHIRTPNQGWRYSILVKTDVLYGSKDGVKDLPSSHKYQNIVMNGGVCGRRAFFGRFILRSFGIPVWGVTQKAHAAVGRWTPNGWVVNLGAAFKWSWWDHDKTPRSGADFLLETQARKVPSEYLKVLRAQWIGDALGEQDYNDRSAMTGGFWNAVAQYEARAIAAASNAKELGPVGQDVAESNESKEADHVEEARTSEDDKKVVVGNDGAITIPAAAISMPQQNTAQIIVMESYAGGMQLHCARDLKADQQFQYTFEAPQAGNYELVARVVTVQSDQKLTVAANDSKEAVEISLPYTMGRWEQAKPVKIPLVKGSNVLRFTRPASPGRGVTIKDFTLKPLK